MSHLQLNLTSHQPRFILFDDDRREYVKAAQDMKPYAKYIEDFVGKSSRPSPRDKWHGGPGPEFLFDPMENIQRTRIPILAFFGENDKQADPVQGAEAYRNAIKLGGHSFSKVVLVPGVDHALVFSPTGCIKEWKTRTEEQWDAHSPLYLETLEEWLSGLKGHRPIHGDRHDR